MYLLESWVSALTEETMSGFSTISESLAKRMQQGWLTLLASGGEIAGVGNDLPRLLSLPMETKGCHAM